MTGIFDQGGGKSAQFINIGDQVVGKVLAVTVVPKTKYGTSDQDYWPSGDAIQQAKVSLQTELRVDPDDDGVRNLYATISGKEGGQFRVIQDAIAEAHGKRHDLEPGATLGLRLVGLDPDSKNPQNPRKLYAAFYQKPDGAFGGQPPQQQAQQAPPQQQQPQFQPPQQQQPQFTPPAQQANGWGQQQQAPAQQPQQGGWQQAPGQTWPEPQQPAQQPQQAQQWGQQPQSQPQPQQQFHPGGFDPNTGELGQQGQPQPGFYGNQPQPAQQAPQQFQQPAAQVPAPQQQQVVNIDQQRVQALIAAGMPDQVIFDATGISPEALNMARNAGLGGAPGGIPQ